MTQNEALLLALEALEFDSFYGTDKQEAITAIKAALEAKDEKANDELRRLHDLLGKANALARIRANKIDELEQRLTKTEAQLGEAVWNYGELKREQLANQQKTSGSPINTSTALEAKDEPVVWNEGVPAMLPKQKEGETFIVSYEPKLEAKDEPVAWISPTELLVMRGNALGGAKDWRVNVGLKPEDGDVGLYTAPQQRTWVGLTRDEILEARWHNKSSYKFARVLEAKLKERNL